jgi:hypothetical protein
LVFWIVFDFTTAITYWFAVGILALMSAHFFAEDWLIEHPAAQAISRRVVYIWLAAFAVSVQNSLYLARYPTWLLGFLCVSAFLAADFTFIWIHQAEESDGFLDRRWISDPVVHRIGLALMATMYSAYRLNLAPWLVPVEGLILVGSMAFWPRAPKESVIAIGGNFWLIIHAAAIGLMNLALG